jgi:23S rRNA pseudouridine2605 synthase
MSPARVSLPRALSKLGYCSRDQAFILIDSGKVAVNNHIERNTAKRIDLNHDRIAIEGKTIRRAVPCYVMVNKPRGLITTRADEKKRDTVYQCLKQAQLPNLVAVGRLDKASEGMLLFTNDTAWANRISAPEFHLYKVYHVQINQICDAGLLQKISAGVKTDQGEILRIKQVRLLRMGKKNSWIEIVLTEGKNRHIRRILESLGISVLRLVRVAIGPLQLGNLTSGQFRILTNKELAAIQENISAKKI